MFPDGGRFPRRGPVYLVLDLLQFLPTAAIVDDSVDYPIVGLQGHFNCVQRVFWLHGDGLDLPVDAGEQLRPLVLLGVFLGQGRKPLCLRSNFLLLFFV